jgi:hypothetical protein
VVKELVKKGIPSFIEVKALAIHAKICIKLEDLSFDQVLIDYIEKRQLESC